MFIIKIKENRMVEQTVIYSGLGWGTLALLNAAIAQLHARRTFLWYLISLLIGPIATLILLLTYKKH